MNLSPTILLTGGSGRLGTALQALLSGVVAPAHAEMDITDAAAVEAAVARWRPAVLVHCAAYTDVSAAERERAACWAANVDGTRHIVRALLGTDIRLVHLSTDYVFEGSRGGYREDDTPGPVRNYYSLTKLVGESLVRLLPNHLVIRTSFRTSKWPYPVAFSDLYTSQDYLDVIAPDIALAVARCAEIPYDTLHIVTERKTPYELAIRRNPDIRTGSKTSVAVALPDDISLDYSRWQMLKEQWK